MAWMPVQLIRFQSTLPVWGATAPVTVSVPCTHISIHAPRVGSDVGITKLPSDERISIHAPRVGSDRAFLRGGQTGGISIHAPRVGSDSRQAAKASLKDYFNPRSPCGERLQLDEITFKSRIFQSTLPVWGATVAFAGGSAGNFISIHAPRVGSDST